MPTHYTTLNLPHHAQTPQIRASYHRLALKIHPDKNLGSEAACDAFQRLQIAYETLSNHQTRALYDEQLLQDHRRARAAARGLATTRYCFDHDHEHRARLRREKMRKERTDTRWAEREREMSEGIEDAEAYVKALAKGLGDWERAESKKRRGRGMWAFFRGLGFGKRQREEGKENKDWGENEEEWASKVAALEAAKMELERVREGVAAMRRLRFHMVGAGRWVDEEEAEEEGGDDGIWKWIERNWKVGM